MFLVLFIFHLFQDHLLFGVTRWYHIKYLNPFPKNLGEVLNNFDQVLIPEINDGQLDILIRNKFLIPSERLCKIKGLPFMAGEIIEKVKEIY